MRSPDTAAIASIRITCNGITPEEVMWPEIRGGEHRFDIGALLAKEAPRLRNSTDIRAFLAAVERPVGR